VKRIIGYSALAFVVVFGATTLALKLNQGSNLTTLLGARPKAPVVLASSPIAAPGWDFKAAAQRVTPSVVSIDTVVNGQDFFGQTALQRGGSGSGVIVTPDGYIVTNNHVVEGAFSLTVTLKDGRTLEGKLVGRDPRSDLAVVKVNANDLIPCEFGDSEQ
jgi:S1-C subfamily serine protease